MHARREPSASYGVSVRNLAVSVRTQAFEDLSSQASFPRRVAPVAVALTSCCYLIGDSFGKMLLKEDRKTQGTEGCP